MELGLHEKDQQMLGGGGYKGRSGTLNSPLDPPLRNNILSFIQLLDDDQVGLLVFYGLVGICEVELNTKF